MPEAEALLDIPVGGFAADLALIREAAAQAGRIALRYFRKDPEVWMKIGDSPVTEADFAVDRFLRETLLEARPSYGWLSEETPDTPERLARARTFVVDPIDGTRAFVEGRDIWCVSIAVVEAGRPLAGVLDCPARGEIYWAAKGSGAFKDGARLFVGEPSPAPLIGGPKAMVAALPDHLRRVLRHKSYIPSLAYRLVMVAEGALDASFVKPNSHDWDIAAADLVLSEAGGEIRDAQGRAPVLAGPDPRHGPLVAGHGALLDLLAGVIAGKSPAPITAS